MAASAAAQNVIELHGSGTTNPSVRSHWHAPPASLRRACSWRGQCLLAAAHACTMSLPHTWHVLQCLQRWFWEIFDIMEARAKEPLHMTYRAIGSSTGMQEFVGPNSNFVAQADFGAGDIPMSSVRFAQLVANNREMLHVPVAIGAIALFHSVPESELGGQPLSLDACLIARIYAGDITTWNHPDILAENPTLTATAPIKVAHRVEGSSSTSGFTTYLSEKCPSEWTLDGASTFCANGCDNDWPVGVGREGSGGMSDYLEAESYAIAYIDSGHGIASGLAEIALQNFDGVFLKSSAADVGAAATRGIASGVFPTDPSASFADVELFDLPGPTT
eukprot:scaffold927_cov135-Isochrysis_galbana.AAC.1